VIVFVWMNVSYQNQKENHIAIFGAGTIVAKKMQNRAHPDYCNVKIMISYLVDTIVEFVVLNLIYPILIPINIFLSHYSH